MSRWNKQRGDSRTLRARSRRRGLTLIELIVSFSILLILSTMALPLTRIRVQREKERRLRAALTEMRVAIDRYKDAADAGELGQLDEDNHGYPESLEILVEGVEIQSGGMGGMGGAQGIGGLQGMGGARGIGGAFGGQGGQRSGFGQSGIGGGSSFGQQRSGFGSSRSGSGSGGGFGSRRNSGLGSNRSSFGQRDDRESDESGTVRFLRRIPIDPITGRADWGMRSIADSPDSMSWGGRNVFDVFSMSMDTALDGTRYSEW